MPRSFLVEHLFLENWIKRTGVFDEAVCVHKNVLRAFRQFLLRHEIAVSLELLLFPAARGAPEAIRIG